MFDTYITYVWSKTEGENWATYRPIILWAFMINSCTVHNSKTFWVTILCTLPILQVLILQNWAYQFVSLRIIYAAWSISIYAYSRHPDPWTSQKCNYASPKLDLGWALEMTPWAHISQLQFWLFTDTSTPKAFIYMLLQFTVQLSKYVYIYYLNIYC